MILAAGIGGVCKILETVLINHPDSRVSVCAEGHGTLGEEVEGKF